MRDGRAFLAFMSSFWTSLWSDSATLSTFLGVHAELLNRLYLQAVALAAPAYIDSLPLFREDFWHLIYFARSSRVGTGFKYPLPNPYVELPFLFNTPFEPTKILRARQDFTLEIVDAQTYIIFQSDPFADPTMPIRDLGADQELFFFAPKVYTDESDLYDLFGHLTKIVRPTSEQYRQLVKGILYLYVNGPVLFVLNAGLNLAAGYPVSRDFDVVTQIDHDAQYYLITTQKGHLYKVPLVLNLSVGVGSALRPMSTFAEDIRIVDHQTEPLWWAGGAGNKNPDGSDIDPAKRVVPYLSPELVPAMDDRLRDDPAIIDHVFDTYLKYSVFGVKYNTLVLGNFVGGTNPLAEFFGVIWDVKPHWVAPYAQGYFRIEEFIDAPLDEAAMSFVVELTRLIAENPGYDAAEYAWRPVPEALNSGLRLGTHAGRSRQTTAYDLPELEALQELAEEMGIPRGPCVLGSQRVLDPMWRGGGFERFELGAQLELSDSFDLAACNDVVFIEQAVEDIALPLWHDDSWFSPTGFGSPPPP